MTTLLSDLKSAVESSLLRQTLRSIGLNKISESVGQILVNGLRLNAPILDALRETSTAFKTVETAALECHYADPRSLDQPGSGRRPSLPVLPTTETIFRSRTLLSMYALQTLENGQFLAEFCAIIQPKICQWYGPTALLLDPAHRDVFTVLVAAFEQNDPKLLIGVNLKKLHGFSWVSSHSRSHSCSAEPVFDSTGHRCLSTVAATSESPRSISSEPPRAISRVDTASSLIANDVVAEETEENLLTESVDEVISRKPSSTGDAGGGVNENDKSIDENDKSIDEGDKRLADDVDSTTGFGCRQLTDSLLSVSLDSRGQSLRTFLEQQDFQTRTVAEQENAQIVLAETVIAAIELMKSKGVIETRSSPTDVSAARSYHRRTNENGSARSTAESVSAHSALGIEDSKLLSNSPLDVSLPSGLLPAAESPSPLPSFLPNPVEEVSPASTLVTRTISESDSGVAAPQDDLEGTIQPTSNDQLSKHGPPSTFEENTLILTAEQVALAILKDFEDHHLPPLHWIVPQEQVPQQEMLPIKQPIGPAVEPNGDSRTVSVASSDLQQTLRPKELRGNDVWAPLRRQYIFSILPKPKNLKAALQSQHMRCRGCGARQELSEAKHMRYCHYFGKLFCSGCHQNQRRRIPGHIVQEWDFKEYVVCEFAAKLLQNDEPNGEYDRRQMVNIKDMNPSLYQRSNSLRQLFPFRLQLSSLQAFIMTCSRAVDLQQMLKSKLRPHLYEEIHVYSMDDLYQVKFGPMISTFKQIVKAFSDHILKDGCSLCYARGFICELCSTKKRTSEPEVIFPFQLNKVEVCPKCSSCFHRACVNKLVAVERKKAPLSAKVGFCPRCERIRQRRQKQAESRSEVDSVQAEADGLLSGQLS